MQALQYPCPRKLALSLLAERSWNPIPSPDVIRRGSPKDDAQRQNEATEGPTSVSTLEGRRTRRSLLLEVHPRAKHQQGKRGGPKIRFADSCFLGHRLITLLTIAGAMRDHATSASWYWPGVFSARSAYSASSKASFSSGSPLP